MAKDYQQKEIRLRQQAADLQHSKVTVREMFDENSSMRRRWFVCARYIYFVSNAYQIVSSKNDWSSVRDHAPRRALTRPLFLLG